LYNNVELSKKERSLISKEKFMRNISFTILIIYLFAMYAFAQTEQENWQTFKPVKEEFSLEIPVKMSESWYSIDPLKQIYSGHFSSVMNGNYYFIFSENLLDSEKTNKFSSSKSTIANLYIAESVSEHRIAANPVEVNNFIGKQYKFSDDEGFYQQILLISVKNRTYIFQTFSQTENDAAVKRFFDSIKLSENEELSRIMNSPVDEPSAKVPKAKREGLGSGSGSGSGSGDETRLPTQTAKPTPNNNAANTFRIVSQARANYTDRARIYNVSGVVRLRVTFLTNGTIGAIKVINRLPLGLTNSAIKAAKAIQFEPGINTISKTVEYRFNLY
jgi:Gram-negative bacterial TonB protein C-terminal